jgi:hypothetical protein
MKIELKLYDWFISFLFLDRINYYFDQISYMYPILEFTGSKYLAEIFEKIMADLARTLEVLEKFSLQDLSNGKNGRCSR